MNYLLRLSTLIPVLLVLFLSAGCASGQDQSNPGLLATPSATLIPPYIATPQSAQANAQATSAAVEAMLESLKPTQTALSMMATQSQATQAMFAQQTATAQSDQATATAASWMQVTAQAEQTRTAYALSVQATQTQAVLNQIMRDDQEAQNAAWFTTWAWRTALVLMFTLAFIAGLLTVTTAWQHRQWILTRLGIIRWGPDGKPFWTFASAGGGIVIVDPTRSTGPGTVIDAYGQLNVAGAAEMAFQEQTNARAQAAELLLAAGPANSAHERRIIVRQAAQLMAPSKSAEPAPTYLIVRSLDQIPPALAAPDPATLQVLDADWQEIEED